MGHVVTVVARFTDEPTFITLLSKVWNGLYNNEQDPLPHVEDQVIDVWLHCAALVQVNKYTFVCRNGTLLRGILQDKAPENGCEILYSYTTDLIF